MSITVDREVTAILCKARIFLYILNINDNFVRVRSSELM